MQTVDKVHRAVDGVDDKDMLSVQIIVAIVFFAEETGIGDGFGKAPDQQLLYAPVIFGHHVAPVSFALGQNVVGLQNEAGRLGFGLAQQGKNFIVRHAVCPPQSESVKALYSLAHALHKKAGYIFFLENGSSSA